MSVVARDVRSTAEWLHAKLGSDDGWAAASISALLTAEILQNISLCFEQLDLAVKIKVQRAVAVASPTAPLFPQKIARQVLLSLLSFPKLMTEDVLTGMRAVLDVAGRDPEPWVQVGRSQGRYVRRRRGSRQAWRGLGRPSTILCGPFRTTSR